MRYQSVFAITLGPQKKLIRFSNTELAQTLSNLVPGTCVTEPIEEGLVDYVVEYQHSPKQFLLKRGAKTLFFSDKLGDLAVMLNNELISALVDDYSEGLALHSACLIRNGKSLLMPAVSGSGKTTLTAWLLTQGFDYASDELVITGSTGTVTAFPRPLNLKSGSIPVARSMGIPCDDEMLKSELAYLVRPELFGATQNNTPSQPVAIVFPQYQKDAEFIFEQLSPARAAHLLLGCLINARNLPQSGLPLASGLCRSLPTWSLTYSDFSQLESLLKRINQLTA